MRLLCRQEDGSFALTEDLVKENELPKYAVLSHTWLTGSDEIIYDDIVRGVAHYRDKAGYAKIKFCCDQAAKDDLEHFWVDSCCIDKSSSSELSEAINTMFKWYRNATRCYAYLVDVSATEDDLTSSSATERWRADFRASQWHTRGWTLQELLAPVTVEFYSFQGTRLGDKRSLQELIHETTRIPKEALQSNSLETFTVEERLSWAKNRQTTRPEDKAYCLLGIFNISMSNRYGEGDAAFTRLKKKIRKKYEGRTEDSETSSQALDYKLLETLPSVPSAAFDAPHNTNALLCLSDTRIELLKEINDWVDGSDSRYICWLSGIAGTGKSTVARTIAQVYNDKHDLGGSYFFSRDSGKTSHAHELFTTLASQLAKQIPHARQHICEAIMADKMIAQGKLEDQWDALVIGPLWKLGESRHPRTIVFVLDALDECDDENAMTTILGLLRATKKLDKVKVRVLVTSRPETPIRMAFQHIPESERITVELHDIASSLVDRDLKLFFEDKFATIRQEHRWSRNWPGPATISRLVEASCGLFIWASLACRYIRNGKQAADERIATLVNGHRSGAGPEKQLDMIYTMVLKDHIPDCCQDIRRKEARKNLRLVLGSIVTLLSPLSVPALGSLLDSGENHVNGILADLHTIFNIPGRRDRPIRLHHPTFRDFILDRSRCSALSFCIDEKSAHKVLVDSCIRILCTKLKQNICGLESPGTCVNEVSTDHIERCIPPELQYACLYWVEHCRLSEMKLRDNDDVHRFFQEHFLHWLEAINLIHKGSEMAAIVRMYQTLLNPADNPSQLPFIKDSRQFVFATQSIAEQTPLQIYCAGLSFIRHSNLLRHRFWPELQTWMKSVRIAEAVAAEVKVEYNYVNDLAFTPDGQRVASGSIDEVVRVWDVTTKGAVTRFEGQKDKVSAVAISADGRRLASGSDDHTVMVWDPVTKIIQYTLTGHTSWVNTVAFSSTSKLLASGSVDATIKLWNATSGNEIGTLQAGTSCVNSISFSPVESLLASGAVDQKVRLWDVHKGAIYMTLEGHSGPVNSVRFSWDGNTLASGSDDMTVRIWNVATGAVLKTLQGHLKKVCAVAFSQDSKRIASGSEDKTIRVWDAASGIVIATLVGHTSGINAVTYCPQGQILASCAFNDECMLWDAETGETRGKLEDFGRLEMFPESKTHSKKVTCLIPSPDGHTIASASLDGLIKLWRQASSQAQLEGHVASINQLAFSPHGEMLCSASEDRTVKVWRVDSQALLYNLDGHSGAVRHVRFSHNGHLLASCCTEKTIILWDAATGVALNRLMGHTDIINNIVFSPDDHRIASSSADRTIRIWEVHFGTDWCCPLDGHTDSVNCVTFSVDGLSLASCSSDHRIMIWNESKPGSHTLSGHTGPVRSVAFSQSSMLLVSCSDDMSVRIWDLLSRTVQHVIEVGVSLHRVSFCNEDRDITTDRGIVPLLYPLTRKRTRRETSKLFVTEDWLQRNLKNYVHLDKEYYATSVAISSGSAVLGHASGAVSFIDL